MGERSLAWRVGGTEASEVSEPRALGDTREGHGKASTGIPWPSGWEPRNCGEVSPLFNTLHAALVEERPLKRSQLKVVLVLCKGISCVRQPFKAPN